MEGYNSYPKNEQKVIISAVGVIMVGSILFVFTWVDALVQKSILEIGLGLIVTALFLSLLRAE